MTKTLIFIPTYNERDNAPRICREIFNLGLDADVLFVDDASPDGTGEALEEMKPHFPRLIVHHRSGKLGIGSAHADAIQWAYDHDYQILVTMDCDFTHLPEDIPKMIAAAEGYDVAVGSRFMTKDSLPGWSRLRKLATTSGHFLTQTLLGIPFDASGAFRVYHLTTIPREVFQLVAPTGYAFFFESLFILSKNGFRIAEIPIVLPGRTSGSSKMSLRHIVNGLARLLVVPALAIVRPGRFKLPDSTVPQITDQKQSSRAGLLN